MLKADQAHSTIASGLNRRGILSGGSVTRFPRSSPFSQEFLAWYELAKILPKVLAEDDAWIGSQYGHGILDPNGSPHVRLCNEMRPWETYLCMRSTMSRPASLPPSNSQWSRGGPKARRRDDRRNPFPVDPFALEYYPTSMKATAANVPRRI